MKLSLACSIQTMDDHHFATSPLGVPNALRRRMDGELTASSLGPASNLEKYFTIKVEHEGMITGLFGIRKVLIGQQLFRKTSLLI